MARSIAKRSLVVLLSTGLAGLLAACAPGIGNAISVDKFQDSSDDAPNEYIINIGDMLSIAVWEQPTLSGPQVVRPDGKISMQLINEIQAAGKTPRTLQTDIEAALKKVILNPQVNVGIANPKLPTIPVIGEVTKQGDVDLRPGMGVAQAIAAAGGLTPFAHKDRIFVNRKTPKEVVIHFTYEALLQGTGKAAQFKLKPGDSVVVR